MPLLVHEAEVFPSSNNKATLLEPSKEPRVRFFNLYYSAIYFYTHIYTYNQLCVSPHDFLRLGGGPWVVWVHSNCVQF